MNIMNAKKRITDTDTIQTEKVKIDNAIFRLHHTYTVFVILLFTILVSVRELAGDHIECTRGALLSVPEDVINTYCWMNSRYTKPEHLNITVWNNRTNPEEKPVKYMHFYQWVIFLLLFQAAMFYVPKLLWVSWEGGTLRLLTTDLKVGRMEEREKEQKIHILADYFSSSWNRYDWYARKYFICQVLCLLNLVVQAFILDELLDQNFFTYGIFSCQYFFYGGKFDPMLDVFPRITSCTFYQFASDPTNIEKSSVLCVVALNNMYDKIYLFFWFWFCILFLLTLGSIFLFIMLFFIRPARVNYLCSVYGYDREEDMRTLVREASFGDWFILYQLGKNVDFIVFRDLVRVISHRIENESITFGAPHTDASTQVLSDDLRRAASMGWGSQKDQLGESTPYSIEIQIETVEEAQKSDPQTSDKRSDPRPYQRLGQRPEPRDQNQDRPSWMGEGTREHESLWVRLLRSVLSKL
ncbi:innexin shaking-B-like [Parasteatoda tepidariorum]|uniref:innexin shaking-B-like n=1 Tax=Parasteatoda tepidariorum TaxID=114398 RepID=UPI00077FD9C8|nr:innexin shaking-B-like [Parasteatoda tepidariorum]